MYGWNLPETIDISGEVYRIRTDFRAVLDILTAFNDPDLPDYAKTQVMIEILYVDIPPVEHLQEAAKKAIEFIDCGQGSDKTPKPRTMDWEQDANIIFPAINKVAGYETRNPNSYTHWWTFLGYFNEIEDGLFSQVLSIRQKRAKGKKLEKWEREFERENAKIVFLRKKETEEERKEREAEKEAVDALFY